jgi:hypothetical protein
MGKNMELAAKPYFKSTLSIAADMSDSVKQKRLNHSPL